MVGHQSNRESVDSHSHISRELVVGVPNFFRLFGSGTETLAMKRLLASRSLSARSVPGLCVWFPEKLQKKMCKEKSVNA